VAHPVEEEVEGAVKLLLPNVRESPGESRRLSMVVLHDVYCIYESACIGGTYTHSVHVVKYSRVSIRQEYEKRYYNQGPAGQASYE
jgi:hypothetical protein